MPSMGDILFVLIMQFLLFTAPNLLFGDGSTGWHLVSGAYVLEQGTVPRHDLISYTFPNAPWVAYEWLSDLLTAGFEKLGGLNAVAVYFAALFATVNLLLYNRCRRTGCHFALVIFLVLAGAIASSMHWLARPHIFTQLGVFIFSTTLEDFHRQNIGAKRLLITLPLVMLLWVNSHPAFLLGIVLLIIYLFSEAVLLALSAAESRAETMHRFKMLCGALGLTAIASLINPYGPALYSYIIEYLKGARILAETIEYQSPIFHGGLQPICLEIIFAALIVSLSISGKRPSLPLLLTVLAFGHLALSAVRSIPLFVIVTLPLIAEGLANQKLPIAQPAGLFGKLSDTWRSVGETVNQIEFTCRMHLLPALVTVALLVITCMRMPTVSSGFDPQSMPTSTLDYIVTKKLPETSGFSFDNWGGYIRYKSGIRVMARNSIWTMGL
jgi:hypothetical protein